jgi:hypothetical protein
MAGWDFVRTLRADLGPPAVGAYFFLFFLLPFLVFFLAIAVTSLRLSGPGAGGLELVGGVPQLQAASAQSRPAFDVAADPDFQPGNAVLVDEQEPYLPGAVVKVIEVGVARSYGDALSSPDRSGQGDPAAIPCVPDASGNGRRRRLRSLSDRNPLTAAPPGVGSSDDVVSTRSAAVRDVEHAEDALRAPQGLGDRRAAEAAAAKRRSRA